MVSNYLKELQLVNVIFLFCGHDLQWDHKRSTPRWLKIVTATWRSLIYVILLVDTINKFVTITIIISTPMGLTFDQYCFTACHFVFQLLLTIFYVRMAVNINKWRVLFQKITTATEDIHSSVNKAIIKRTIHRWSVVIVIIAVATILAAYFGVFFSHFNKTTYTYNNFVTTGTLLTNIMSYFKKFELLALTIYGPHAALVDILPIFVSDTLCKLFQHKSIDNFSSTTTTDTEKSQKWLNTSSSVKKLFLSELLNWHRQMCDLVQTADNVLSTPMLWYTGIKALSMIVLFQRVNFSHQETDVYGFFYWNILGVAFFVIQTIFASRVNEQVPIF